MNKNKLNIVMDPKEPSLAEQVTNHPAFQWAASNSANVLSGILLFLAVLFFLHRMSANDLTKAENDYISAANSFATLTKTGPESTPTEQQAAFEQLSKILASRPELNSKYDAMVAQALMIQDKPQEAIPFAERTFARVSKDNLPLYIDFAKITLLIENKKYDEALSKSRDLKEKLLPKTEEEPITTLSAYNLLRIAMLEQALDHKTEELQAWEELNNTLFNSKAILSDGGSVQRALFEKIFSEGPISLQNYVEYREKILKSE